MPRPSRTGLVVMVAVLVFWLTPAAVVFGIVVLVTTSGTSGRACGSGGPSDPATNLDSEQLTNAQTVIATAQGMKLPPRAAQIAVATAMQESSLRNLDYGDAAGPDSRGLYQQQTQFYGVSVPTNPVLATQAFLTQVVAIPGWQVLPLTQVAATVQNPQADLRGAYAQWEATAGTLVQRFFSDEAYRLQPCWYRHPVAVEELTALMVAWQAEYSRPKASTGLAAWHAQSLWPCLLRLNHDLKLFAACQRAGAHVAKDVDPPVTDALDFAAFLNTPLMRSQTRPTTYLCRQPV